MRKGLLLFTLVAVLSCTSQTGQSQDTEAESDDGKSEPHAHEVSLLSLLDHVEGHDGSDFLVASGVPEEVAIGHWDERTLSYAELVSVLDNNGLAAIRSDGKVNVVIAQDIASYPITHASEDEERAIPDNEWVSQVIPIRGLDARETALKLRPIISNRGYINATGNGGAIIVVDRYANVQRIERLISQIAETGGT